jgi:N-methylhydantoinase A
MPDGGWQVGIDIGGTFTDLVALLPATGEVRSIKVPTQRNDPVASILAALTAAGLSAEDAADLVHGTTLVTNAIVEDRVEPVVCVPNIRFGSIGGGGAEDGRDATLPRRSTARRRGVSLVNER